MWTPPSTVIYRGSSLNGLYRGCSGLGIEEHRAANYDHHHDHSREDGPRMLYRVAAHPISPCSTEQATLTRLWRQDPAN